MDALNPEQQQIVEHLDGPALVIANRIVDLPRPAAIERGHLNGDAVGEPGQCARVLEARLRRGGFEVD